MDKFFDRNNYLDYILVTVTRKKSTMKMKKSTKSGHSRPDNRWRLQDAKAHLSEVVRQAQQRGPQRVTLHGRDAVVVVRAEEFDRMRRPISGRDIVAALVTSPLAGVNFERITINSPVREVSL
jgi:prevent-host-death family protein